MSEILAVVPEAVTETGRFSFMFLVNADVPIEKCHRPFGFLWRHAKDDNYVDPFKLARGEEGAVGDDGIPRWAINLWEAGQFILAGEVDSVKNEDGLQELLSEVPDCALLVPPTDIEPIELVCQSLGHSLETIRYQGSLATS